MIAIFASGNGSNAKALLEHSKKLSDKVQVAVLICDNYGAGVLDIAKSFGIKAVCIPFESANSYQEAKIVHEEKILYEVGRHKVEWIFLAGYMRILSKNFIDRFHDSHLQRSRIVNIHPSLLPRFPGKSAYEDCFEAQDKMAGITIHFVDEGIDSGTIITQQTFKRYDDDTFEHFKRRGLAIEHQLYPQVLEQICNNRITIAGMKDYE